jgi:hypothetical protein
VLKGTKHLELAKLHRKYGHVVRVNHDELSWTDPNSWKDVRELPQNINLAPNCDRHLSLVAT